MFKLVYTSSTNFCFGPSSLLLPSFPLNPRPHKTALQSICKGHTHTQKKSEWFNFQNYPLLVPFLFPPLNFWKKGQKISVPILTVISNDILQPLENSRAPAVHCQPFLYRTGYSNVAKTIEIGKIFSHDLKKTTQYQTFLLPE